MAGKGEPWALRKMKAENDKYANLARAEDLTLRQASVTSWHAAAEARPGNNAKAETAAAVMCVRRRGRAAVQRRQQQLNISFSLSTLHLAPPFSALLCPSLTARSPGWRAT